MTRKKDLFFNFGSFLTQIGNEKTIQECPRKEVIFSQGDDADAVFYIQKGKVKLTIVSRHGKEAVLAILDRDSFFGEGCMAGQSVRRTTATSMEDSSVVRFSKKTMTGLTREYPEFADFFLSHLLSRNVRIQEDLVDHLFNSSEKRLARAPLLLSHFGEESKTAPVIPKISQETLAEMIGTTRSRVSHFVTGFRRAGYIEFKDGVRVHNSLLRVVLGD